MFRLHVRKAKWPKGSQPIFISLSTAQPAWEFRVRLLTRSWHWHSAALCLQDWQQHRTEWYVTVLDKTKSLPEPRVSARARRWHNPFIRNRTREGHVSPCSSVRHLTILAELNGGVFPWTILTELGHGGPRDRKRGWGAHKWRERTEILSSAL